jgi:hypothetical protein
MLGMRLSKCAVSAMFARVFYGRTSRTFVMLLMAALATACATAPRPPQPTGPRLPSTAVLGPVFTVFNQSTRAVAAAIDGEGRVHLLMAAAGPEGLYHAVIGPTGPEQLETVLQPAPGGRLAAAFDGEGVLRVVAGNQHFVLRDNVWSPPEKGPSCEKLVLAGKLLVCAFFARGGQSGDSRRIDYFSTPLSLGIPVPVPQRNRTLLLACRSASDWVTWAELDPAQRRDVADFAMSGDDTGSVQVLYVWRRRFMATVSGVAIARAPSLADCQARTSENPTVEFSGKATIDNGGMNSEMYDLAIAVDPRTGDSLSIAGAMELHTPQSFMRRGDSIDSPRPVEAHRSGLSQLAGPIRIAPSGDDRFHVLFNVLTLGWHADNKYFYTTHFNGAWSTPVELAEPPTTPWDNESVKLISDGSSRALAVWPDGHQLKARWIDAVP